MAAQARQALGGGLDELEDLGKLAGPAVIRIGYLRTLGGVRIERQHQPDAAVQLWVPGRHALQVCQVAPVHGQYQVVVIEPGRLNLPRLVPGSVVTAAG